MTKEITPIVAGLSRNPGTSISHVRQVFNGLAVSVPDDYMAFLSESNGTEGPIGGGTAKL